MINERESYEKFYPWDVNDEVLHVGRNGAGNGVRRHRSSSHAFTFGSRQFHSLYIYIVDASGIVDYAANMIK